MIMTKRGTNDPEIRVVINSIDNGGNTTLTVAPNFTTAPQSGDSLYAIQTIIPATGIPTDFYLTFKAFAGAGGADIHQFLLTGCAGTWKIATTDNKTLPVVEWEFEVDAWASSEAAGVAFSDTFEPPHPLLGDYLYINNDKVLTAKFGFDPGMTLAELASTAGLQGRRGWMATEKTPEVDVVPYHDPDWLTRLTAATSLAVFFESIKKTVTDEGWAVYLPAAQVVGVTHEDAGNKHLSTKPAIEARYPGTGLDGATPGTAYDLPLYAVGVTR
jgi:hypothetical protein